MFKITAIGNLGKDATINTVNNKNVINFSIASTDKWTDNTGKLQEKTIWIECAYWSDKTKIAEYLKKGTQAYVEGNGDLRQWTTNDGKTGANITCRILQIQLLGSPDGKNHSNGSAQTSNTAGSPPQAQASAQTSGGNSPADDLPF